MMSQREKKATEERQTENCEGGGERKYDTHGNRWTQHNDPPRQHQDISISCRQIHQRMIRNWKANLFTYLAIKMRQ